ncbi:uncharacterized protein LOC133091765 [Eubalaena glacialis]|uniref:uncharacterized protein LOC133091765 n=1 Tax=Eubalaena glacialis TaxID=27606 RepID=UPI002A598592|nr:uncharacterized protein LOC133091765 [Eubalaena glacialis]
MPAIGSGVPQGLFSQGQQHRSIEIRSQDYSSHAPGTAVGAMAAAQTLACPSPLHAHAHKAHTHCLFGCPPGAEFTKPMAKAKVRGSCSHGERFQPCFTSHAAPGAQLWPQPCLCTWATCWCLLPEPTKTRIVLLPCLSILYFRLTAPFPPRSEGLLRNFLPSSSDKPSDLKYTKGCNGAVWEVDGEIFFLFYGPAPVPATSPANGTSPGSNPPVRSGLKEDLEVMRDNVIVELERKLDLNSGSPTPVYLYVRMRITLGGEFKRQILKLYPLRIWVCSRSKAKEFEFLTRSPGDACRR